jgi:hypothetical protein
MKSKRTFIRGLLTTAILILFVCVTQVSSTTKPPF